MTDYLARLKARTGQKPVPDEPPKLTKPGFVGFDGDLGGHFSQATNASEQAEGGSTTDYLARLKARPSQEHIPEGPSKLTKPGFVGFDSTLGGHFSQARSASVGAPSPPSWADVAPPDNVTDAGHLASNYTEAHKESAAAAEFDSGDPLGWAEGFARLDPARPPDDVPHRRWLRFIHDCGLFLSNGWAAKAAALGWVAVDLFGCDPQRPWARIDQAGLLWLMAGRRLVALTADSATIETAGGGRQTYRRVPNGPGQVLAWSLCGGAIDDPASYR